MDIACGEHAMLDLYRCCLSRLHDDLFMSHFLLSIMYVVRFTFSYLLSPISYLLSHVYCLQSTVYCLPSTPLRVHMWRMAYAHAPTHLEDILQHSLVRKNLLAHHRQARHEIHGVVTSGRASLAAALCLLSFFLVGLRACVQWRWRRVFTPTSMLSASAGHALNKARIHTNKNTIPNISSVIIPIHIRMIDGKYLYMMSYMFHELDFGPHDIDDVGGFSVQGLRQEVIDLLNSIAFEEINLRHQAQRSRYLLV